MASTEINDPFAAIGGRKPGNVYKMHKSILKGFGTFLNPFHFTISLSTQNMKSPKLSVLAVTSDAKGKPAFQINLAKDSNVRAVGGEYIDKISYILLGPQFNIAPGDALNTSLCVFRGKLNEGFARKFANARFTFIKSHYSRKKKDGKQ